MWYKPVQVRGYMNNYARMVQLAEGYDGKKVSEEVRLLIERAINKAKATPLEVRSVEFGFTLRKLEGILKN